MDDTFAPARHFILEEARLLERRLFATLFEGAPPTGVVDALRGFQNADGGFGHGLEPDKRCPDSQPIDVEVALQVLVAARTTDDGMVSAACDFLAGTASVAGAGGGVPLAFPSIESYPRAEHWSDWTYRPDLNPTAGLVGLLTRLGVRHPWLAEGARFCWARLDSEGLPGDAHALSEVLVFLERTGEDARAPALVAAIPQHLPTLSWFRADPTDPGYGVTPLHLAPTPASRWRSLFSDDQIEGHLDRLQRDQLDDGGWAITWEPPGQASTLDYRGMETLRALRTLEAYGRLSVTAA